MSSIISPQTLTVVSTLEVLLLTVVVKHLSTEYILSSLLCLFFGYSLVFLAVVRPFHFLKQKFTQITFQLSSFDALRPLLLQSGLVFSSFFLLLYSFSRFHFAPPFVGSLLVVLRALSFSVTGRNSGWKGSMFSRSQAFAAFFLTLFLSLLLLFPGHLISSVLSTISLMISCLIFGIYDSIVRSKSLSTGKKTFQSLVFIFCFFFTLIISLFSRILPLNFHFAPFLSMVLFISLGLIGGLRLLLSSSTSQNSKISPNISTSSIISSIILTLSGVIWFFILLSPALALFKSIVLILICFSFIYIVTRALKESTVSLDSEITSSNQFLSLIASFYYSNSRQYLFSFILISCSLLIDFVLNSITSRPLILISALLKLFYLIEYPLLTLFSLHLNKSDTSLSSSFFVFGPHRLASAIICGTSVLGSCGLFFTLVSSVEGIFGEEEDEFSLFLVIVLSLLSFFCVFFSSKVTSSLAPSFISSKIAWFVVLLSSPLCVLFIISLHFSLQFLLTLLLGVVVLLWIKFHSKWSSKVLILGCDSSQFELVNRICSCHGEVVKLLMFDSAPGHVVINVVICLNNFEADVSNIKSLISSEIRASVGFDELYVEIINKS
ncbi:hypothetical protein RCL1_006768 [Eukaryota sp. TZLM3-RCL]